MGKLVGYRRCVATVPCSALMTPKIKWVPLAEIQSSAVWGLYSVHCLPYVTHFAAFDQNSSIFVSVICQRHTVQSKQEV